MKLTQHRRDEQAELWNGTAGRAWVEAQEVLDGMFEPFERQLVDAVAARGGPVLDVGCGTGSTTLSMARRLGTAAPCTGIDISAPMIAVARTHASRAGSTARFILADAEEHAFEPASFRTIVSRFGAMFFADPVRAFANLCYAATDDAGLLLIAWRSASENPFMSAAERAAEPFLPGMEQREANAPGQFSLADRRRVADILEDSGWKDIDIQPLDVECTFPASQIEHYVSRLGPVGRALAEADPDTRAQVIKAVRAAFEPFVHGAQVRFNAACWQIGARATSAQGREVEP
jgi:SAM-dependent methyltransferase